MCKGCSTECCSCYLVPLNVFDVKRLTKNKLFKYARILHIDNKDVDDSSFKCGNDYYKIYLGKRPDSGACYFFSKESDYKCKIHKYRPAACRSYPFLDSDGTLITDRVCPKQKKITKRDLAEGKRYASLYFKELDMHITLVSKWNKSIFSHIPIPKLFIIYLMLANVKKING